MTWGLNIAPAQFPILTPGQMSPMGGAFQNALNSYQQMVQAKYAPQKIQADILYKNVAPYSYLAKALENPLVVAQLTKSRQLPSAISSLMSMPGLGGSGTPAGTNTGDSFFGKLARAGRELLGQPASQEVPRRTEESTQESSAPETSSEPVQTSSTDMNTMPPGLNEQQRKDWIAGAPGSAINPGVQAPSVAPYSSKEIEPGVANPSTTPMPNTGRYQAAPDSPVTDPRDGRANVLGDTGDDTTNAVLANNPKFATPAYTAGKAGLETTAKETASNVQDLWKEKNKAEAKRGAEAINNLAYVDKFENNYNKLDKLEKGAVFGKTYHFSDAAQGADNAATNMMSGAAQAMQMGHITNQDFEIAEKSKVSREMNDKPAQDMINFYRGVQQNELERKQFDSWAQKNKIPPQDADTIWLKYRGDRPFYNAATGKVNEKNLKGWREYTDPKKIVDILTAQPEMPAMKNTEHDPLGIL